MTLLNDNLAVQALAVAVCRLVSAVSDFMTNTAPLNDASVASSLLAEWQELFSAAIFGSLLPLFVNLAGTRLRG